MIAPDGEEKKKAAIRSISDNLFDFAVIPKYALGPHWKQFNPDPKKVFADLFRQLLEGVYMDRLLQYKDEKVIFKNETALSGTQALVQSQIAAPYAFFQRNPFSVEPGSGIGFRTLLLPFRTTMIKAHRIRGIIHPTVKSKHPKRAVGPGMR